MYSYQFIMVKSVSSSPRLDTVLMVEKVLSAEKLPVSVASLKRLLPRQVNHNTLLVILEYLESSRKINVGLKGVSWVF